MQRVLVHRQYGQAWGVVRPGLPNALPATWLLTPVPTQRQSRQFVLYLRLQDEAADTLLAAIALAQEARSASRRHLEVASVQLADSVAPGQRWRREAEALVKRL